MSEKLSSFIKPESYSKYEVKQGLKDDLFGFEETCNLLIFGRLPSKEKLKSFKCLLSKYRNLPDDFVRDMILAMSSKNIMNSLHVFHL